MVEEEPIPRPTDSGAIAALIVGLISPLGAVFSGVPGIVLGTIAVFLGLRAQGRIKRSGGTVGGARMALTGWIVGLCAIALGLVAAALTIGSFLFVSKGGKGGP